MAEVAFDEQQFLRDAGHAMLLPTYPRGSTVVAVGVVGGVLMEWLTRQVRSSTYAGMVVTIGLVLVVQGVIWVAVGTDARFVDSPLPNGAFRVPFADARVSTADVALVVIGIATMLALQLLMTKTRVGLLMRGVVDNPALVGRMGTDPNAVAARRRGSSEPRPQQWQASSSRRRSGSSLSSSHSLSCSRSAPPPSAASGPSC